jgi:hypothetical protein
LIEIYRSCAAERKRQSLVNGYFMCAGRGGSTVGGDGLETSAELRDLARFRPAGVGCVKFCNLIMARGDWDRGLTAAGALVDLIEAGSVELWRR